MFTRRHFAMGTAIAALASGTSLTAAQTVFNKTVKIVVGFPPGGAADSVARLLAEQLQGKYAPTVIIDNRAGAGGRLGAQIVKAGEADGSQFLLTPASILTIYPHVYKKLSYDAMKDFVPVASVAKVTFASSVSSAVPSSVKTVADYVTWAKAHPKEANFGSAAAGATPHFVGTMLGKSTGIPLNHIPFKGGAPLVADLLGGQVQAGINVLPEVLPHVSSGKLRILAVSGMMRSRYVPDVPTFAESGFKDVEADEYFAVFAPAKTPMDVIVKLNAAIRAATRTPRMIEGLEKLSFDVGGESPAEFARIVQAEHKRWGPIVSASGFSSEE